MNENKPTADAHAQRRRRVLRGAISAPVVLTISSGASATMASNLRCVANQVNTPAHGVRSHASGATVTAGLVRVQLYSQTTSSGWPAVTTTRHYVKGSDLHAIGAPVRPPTWITGGQWQQINLSTNALEGSPVTMTTSPSPLSGQFAVVQFDQNANILSVGADIVDSSGKRTSMVFASCWTSFKTGAV